MRPILSIAVLAGFSVLIWHGLAMVAPQIERRIDASAEAIAATESPHPMRIATRGRALSVSGLADSEAARDSLLAHLRAIPGVRAVENRIRVLPTHSPYRFSAVRPQDQPLRIEGDAPDAASERAILDAARAITKGTSLQSALTLAAGIPDPDWMASVRAGLRALGALADGAIEITDREGVLTGRAASDDVRDRILGALADDPVVQWQATIDLLLPHADPYSFHAETGPDGASYSGHAPNPSVQSRLVEAASKLGGGTATGAVTIAEGMPGRAWPPMVTRGVEALALLESGTFRADGMDAYLEGRAATPENATAARERAGNAVRTNITVADPTPAARLIVTVETGDDTPRLVEGRLPEGLDPDALARAMPELELAGASIETGGRATADGWDGVIAALALALPRLESGRAAVEADRIRLEGRLRPGFSAATTRTALRAAAGPGWSLDLALDEAPQPAMAEVSLSGGHLIASGILPNGVSPEATLVRLRGAENGGLTSGGAGDPLAWRLAIDALAAASTAFGSLESRIAEKTLTIEGTLLPGASPAEIETALAAALAEGWSSEINAEIAAPEAKAAPVPQADRQPPSDDAAADDRAGGLGPEAAPVPPKRHLASAVSVAPARP
ncbi:BON domain-containing protein [Limibaculum sp. M0105]|uniref:BON domain-containing protein n=1 Tax=Thermohalobaculum xanthum TaxID=2753746 RepID=A0A8J7MB96_9RHOB|nr:BON domain-containing protein [Thermohalobaculum xanthum]MBK0401118.1 BON domain-containing protein [Thermohalobaculum xanthum]